MDSLQAPPTEAGLTCRALEAELLGPSLVAMDSAGGRAQGVPAPGDIHQQEKPAHAPPGQQRRRQGRGAPWATGSSGSSFPSRPRSAPSVLDGVLELPVVGIAGAGVSDILNTQPLPAGPAQCTCKDIQAELQALHERSAAVLEMQTAELLQEEIAAMRDQVRRGDLIVGAGADAGTVAAVDFDAGYSELAKNPEEDLLAAIRAQAAQRGCRHWCTTAAEQTERAERIAAERDAWELREAIVCSSSGSPCSVLPKISQR